MIRPILLFLSLLMIFSLTSIPELMAQDKVEKKQTLALSPAANASFALDGYLSKRIGKSVQNYFLETPESSPAILQVLQNCSWLPLQKE